MNFVSVTQLEGVEFQSPNFWSSAFFFILHHIVKI